MKILKYVLLTIFVLAILFIAKGFLTPEIYYESSISVDKSAAEAWAVMSDDENLPKWINGYKRSEHVSGTPNTIGVVSNIYVDNGGEEMVMQETVTEFEINERLAMTFAMDFMNMDYEMLFEEKNGQTFIMTKSSTKGNGIIAKSMISFMKGAMKAEEDKNLNSLKVLIEDNTKDYFPETMEESFESSFE